jgi:hypothetical protein
MGLIIIGAALNTKQRGLQVFPVPKEMSKQENIRIATTMINSLPH